MPSVSGHDFTTRLSIAYLATVLLVRGSWELDAAHLRRRRRGTKASNEQEQEQEQEQQDRECSWGWLTNILEKVYP